MAETPTIRCPQCSHPIDDHVKAGCMTPAEGHCRMTPNLIAVALMFGELTPPSTPGRMTRRPDGGWE